jgi:hypothetical protein
MAKEAGIKKVIQKPFNTNDLKNLLEDNGIL